MKKAILLLGIILIYGTNLSAQIVKGQIFDSQLNETLAGVNISYKYGGQLQGTVSNIDGQYEINVPADAIILTFSYVGYETVEYPLIISGKETITKNIYMKLSSEVMNEIVVSVGRFEQKLSDITVSMDVLKPAAIDRQNSTDLRAVISTLPGVDVNDKQPSIRGGSGWTYGVGSRSQILVDGISVLTPGVGEINWNIIPMENIDQVEVIKGASSVLYGSSALNGLISIQTKRPGLEPETKFSIYGGIYGNPANEDYQWWSKDFWSEGKYPVEPMFRKNVLSGVRNPLYTGVDFSHTRRIGNFDVTGSLNLFTDEGYRKGGYNKRVRAGGNITYHDPKVDKLNYGMNVNYLNNEYGDFFIWRSANSAYESSPIADMGRQHNMIYIDPFLNYYNTSNNTSHKIKGRFFHKNDNIIRKGDGNSIIQTLQNIGITGDQITEIIDVAQNPEQLLPPLLPPLLSGDINGLVDVIKGMGNKYLPNAGQEDYMDLISWVINNPPPGNSNDIPQWILNAINPQKDPVQPDKTYSYFLDYQFSKRFNNDAVLSSGATYEHVTANSIVTGNHDSDNIGIFTQYDHKFFDRLNLSLGVRFEYYRVDSHDREAETELLGVKLPFKPVFRGGLNYQLAEYSFLRASFGQGYRYPSLTEKFVVKDIGGVGAYPNYDLKPESGYNVELGIKQGYQIGPFKGFVDLSGFYTYYKDMIEFNFGIINADKDLGYPFITSLTDIIAMVMNGQMPSIGVKFENVSRARIYGGEISTNGFCDITPNMKLIYSMGYTYIEPEDVNADKRNQEEEANPDIFAMKSKSNTSKYLKYRQKHSVKGTFDVQWNRLSIGTNLAWKSKTLAVDYLMADERDKPQLDLMDHARSLLFGDLQGYWNKNNKGYFTMDLRLGVDVTKNVHFQWTINNLLNKEYSVRPMDVSAPRTWTMKMTVKL